MTASDDDEVDLRKRLLRAETALARLVQLLDSAAIDDRGTAHLAGLDPADRVRHLVEELESLKCQREAMGNSVRYRLGALLVDALRSPGRLVDLPRAAINLLRGTGVASRIQGAFHRRLRWLHPTRRGAPPAHRQASMSSGRPIDLPDATELFGLPGPPVRPVELAGLHVAAILDPFSIGNLGPECHLLVLDPDAWAEQIRKQPVHLLLVESAWTGSSGQWVGLADKKSDTLASIVHSCREAGIATAFWNKEDPLHYQAFLPTARLFDHVFTTDATRIPRYKLELGHDRVHLLPFALQPKTHNPISGTMRQAASVFGGAWYGRLRERCVDFERVMDALALAGPVTIHDRNSENAQPHQRFPLRFRQYVKASVAYEETAEVFRGHTIGVNLNTIKQSPTMFARRVLELIGCNASVYGNFSYGVSRLFGDLTIATDDGERLLSEAYMELREPDAAGYQQRRLRALRKVLREHTWAHRLAAVFNACSPGEALSAAPPGVIWVVGSARNQPELDNIRTSHERQLGVAATLVVDLPPHLELPHGAMRLSKFQPEPSDWVAIFHPLDYYGPHYLEDLALARSFAAGNAIGKGCWLGLSADEEIHTHHPECEYRMVDALALRRCLFRRDRWSGSIEAALEQLDDAAMHGADLVSVNRLEYLESGHSRGLDDLEGAFLDEGVSLAEANAFVEAMPADPRPSGGQEYLSGKQLAELFQGSDMPLRTSITARGDVAEVCSLLGDDEHVQLTSQRFPRNLVERNEGLELTLQAPVANQLKVSLWALDATGAVLQKTALHRGVRQRIAPARDVAAYRISLDIQGGFVRHLEGLWLGAVRSSPLFMPGSNRILVLCNGYPQKGALYRNAFLHRRVLAYRRQGICVDVVWVTRHEASRSFEFEGVNVVVAAPEAVAATLEHSNHLAIAVHFLDDTIWDAIRAAAHRFRIVVWLHGVEIQAWHHRAFNYCSEEERADAAEKGRARSAFWRQLLGELPPRMHLVFVSSSFAEQTWTDLALRPAADRWSVIHNPIDTDLFRWVPKPAEQRFKVLSIRPHASRIYANDLVAETIRLLSTHPLFSSIQFTLIGDGPLWEQDFAGLERFPNVTLVRQFMSQHDVAKEHARHGIFLVPTRGDTQGVSRDEAMSSGLVPVTCDVGAVGEFLDESCGILCEPEDAQALAEAIVSLAERPEYFAEMSRRAASRVRMQSGIEDISRKELALLLDREPQELDFAQGVQ